MGKRAGIGLEELKVLEYVQGRGEGGVTVGEVADGFGRERGVGRTTVLNVMSRLCRKGYLVRRKKDGVYRYWPREARGQVLRGLVGEFVETVLGGRVSPFVAYLSETKGLTEEDVLELEGLVRKWERTRTAKE